MNENKERENKNKLFTKTKEMAIAYDAKHENKWIRKKLY